MNNSQREQYYAAFVQAEAALRIAEKNVTDAQVAFDQARNNEISSIQAAESQLAAAQSQLEALRNPDANVIAQQQAVVAQARANLQRVRQGGTQAEVAAAQATVAQQQANLERLTVPPRAVDLAEAQARIEVERVALQPVNTDQPRRRRNLGLCRVGCERGCGGGGVYAIAAHHAARN